ncbi:hypothetical protein LguiB_005492 [Lonicera macranthoides]
MGETEVDYKFVNMGLVIVATLVIAKLISALIMPKSQKRLPPVVKAWPVLGGLVWFLKGPVVMLREEYPRLGSVFTLNFLNKNITFLIGPEVSAHFFKASESDLSQQEVYQINVPTFGPGVVYDVDYTVRQEQFRFFTESFRVTKLKGYVDQMVMEAEQYFSKWGDSGEVDLKYELEHLIILIASRCLLGEEVHNNLFDNVSALFHDLDNELDSYDPDRFAPGREEDKAARAFSYISFGGGRHSCLGETFAYLQIKAIWSHLLRNFEFELVSPFPEIDWNAMVAGVKGKVMVRYKRKLLSIE